MGVDTKYGWLVVCANFLVVFIIDGIQLSFGLLLIELLDTFDQGRASTAIISSLLLGLTYLLGPVAGRLSEKFGCRVVVIAGSLISSIGFVISMFVDKLGYLYVTYGFLGGIGFGLMMLPSTVCLMQHFERHRALAVGIAMCGSGAGTFSFNVLTGFLLEKYGWRGAILIHAGIVLNGVACGLIFVPPQKLNKPSARNGTSCGPEKFDDKGVVKDVDDNIVSSYCFKNGMKTVETDVNSEEHCVGGINPGFEVAIGDENVTECNGNHKKNVIEKESENDDNKNTIDSSNNTTTISGIQAKPQNSKDELTKTHKDTADANANTNSVRTDTIVDDESSCSKMCDCTLLKNVKLLTLLSSVLCVTLGYPVPFNFIPDQAVENGMSKQQAYWLASSMGIANIVSRITIGFISDLKFTNRVVLLEVLMLSLGVSTLFSVLMESFEAKLIYTCVFGFLIGGFVVLVDVVIADLFGVEVVARSLGLLMFTIGTGSLLSAPIAGGLYDKTGSYNVTFLAAGSEFFLGACIFPVPFLVERFYKNGSYRVKLSETYRINHVIDP